jgi:hypothetical protein
LLLMGIVAAAAQSRKKDVDAGSYPSNPTKTNSIQKANDNRLPGMTYGLRPGKGPGEPNGPSDPQASGGTGGQSGKGPAAPPPNPDPKTNPSTKTNPSPETNPTPKTNPTPEDHGGMSPFLVVALGVGVLGVGLLANRMRPKGKGIRAEQLRALTAPTVIFVTHLEADGAGGTRYSGKPAQVEFVLRFEAGLEMGQYTIKREPAVRSER